MRYVLLFSLLSSLACSERTAPGTDAGPDAGTGDGAVSDAPTSDAPIAMDAPMFDDAPMFEDAPMSMDTGPVDTGPVDTGPLDSGPVDSGVDSGPVDSGPADSGPVDSGPDAPDARTGIPTGTGGCEMDSECAGGACWDFSDYDRFCFGTVCSVPCGTDTECQDAARDAGASRPESAHCEDDGKCDLMSAGLGGPYACA